MRWMWEKATEDRREGRKGGEWWSDGGEGRGKRGRGSDVETDRTKAGKEKASKYNDTIIKYKRRDTYYGDYGSFPYI